MAGSGVAPRRGLAQLVGHAPSAPSVTKGPGRKQITEDRDRHTELAKDPPAPEAPVGRDDPDAPARATLSRIRASRLNVASALARRKVRCQGVEEHPWHVHIRISRPRRFRHAMGRGDVDSAHSAGRQRLRCWAMSWWLLGQRSCLGGSLPRGSHRSGLAQLRHPARHVM